MRRCSPRRLGCCLPSFGMLDAASFPDAIESALVGAHARKDRRGGGVISTMMRRLVDESISPCPPKTRPARRSKRRDSILYGIPLSLRRSRNSLGTR